MGIQQVRLYTNTVSTVPTTFTDVTAQFSGLNPHTVADETASATITIPNLPSATTVFAWIEAIDKAGNSSGVQPVGSATTKERTIIGRGTLVPGAIFTESSTIGPNYRADKAFDGTHLPAHTARVDNAPVSDLNPHWFQVQFPSSITTKIYRMWACPDGLLDLGWLNGAYKDAPIDWTLQGSQDGVQWTILDTRTNSELPSIPQSNSYIPISLSDPHGSFNATTPGSYLYYRVHVTKTGGGASGRNSMLKISEIEFLGI